MADDDRKKDRTAEWVGYWEDGSMFDFHVKKPHPKVLEHYEKIVKGKSNASIFFPLCGDVVDMVMFADKGHNIVGVECSELGIKTFFTQNKIEYEAEKCDKVKGKLYKSKDNRYKIYCCDLFEFDESVAGQFDAIVDFGSMGAVKKEDLQPYADLMKPLMKPDCVHFLECFLYDLEKFPDSLPHCFTLEQLRGLYGDRCTVELLEEGPYPYGDWDFKEPEQNPEDQKTDGDPSGAPAATDDGSRKDKESQGGDGEAFPDFTGAAYFLIRPK